MKNSTFIERALAAIIDYIFVFIISFTACAWLIINVFADAYDQQVAPFVVMTFLFNPLSELIRLFSSTESYGQEYVEWVVLAVCFGIEVLYYSIFELLPIKKTPGKMILKIKVCYDSKRMIQARIVIRNILKVFSRYVYCVPFIASLFSKNGCTIYDWVTKTGVKKIASDSCE